MTAVLSGAAVAAQSPSEAAEDDVLVEVVDVLEELSREPKARPILHKRLLDLGPRGSSAMFALLSGRASGQGRAAHLGPEAKEFLYEILRAWQPKQVVAEILAQLDEESTLGERLAAIRLLGEVGDGRAVSGVFAVLEGTDPDDLRHPQVHETVALAVAGVLHRDRQAYAAVSGGIDELDPILLPAVVEGLGLDGKGRGTGTLERLLRSDPELDVLVLDALGKVDPWDPETEVGRVAWTVRDYLGSNDPLLRRQAAVSLGRLRDSPSVPDLIDLLEDHDRRVRNAALWALRELTGLRFGDDETDRWQTWYAAELEWFESRSSDLAAKARQSDPAVAVEALREIGRHGLFHEALVEDVVPVLKHQSPQVAIFACSTLALLADPRSLPPMIEALDDPRPGVQQAALVGLRAMTGADLSASSAEWREWWANGATATSS